MGCGLRGTGCEVRVASYRLRVGVMDYGLQVASCRVRVAGKKGIVGRGQKTDDRSQITDNKHGRQRDLIPHSLRGVGPYGPCGPEAAFRISISVT